MEQKDFKLEIVNSLLRKKWHVRGLAKHLGTNHMILFRKFKELYDKNVLDYNEEGKNKIYFLKDTLEARAYIFMAENYKLTKIIEKHSFLRKIIEKIQKDKKINLAVVFGSYAKDTANSKSDVDIYIETEDKKIKTEIESISSKVSVKIGKYDKSSLLIKEIEDNHIIIKGVEKFYENRGFFE